jgi:uncharacterized LabA/DUF88 family protein
MGAYLLIDYYNLPERMRSAGVLSAVMQINGLVQGAFPDNVETHARLYGGWYDQSGLTRDGTRLTQEVMRHFPCTYRGSDGRIRRLTCEIATSLVQAPSELFFATVRLQRGLNRLLRLPHPASCADTPNCSAPSVVEWSRKGCPTPGCPVAAEEAFAYKQQKLVDILLCCDLIALAAGGAAERLFLVSEDDDFIPALIQARLSGAPVCHVRSKPDKARLYDALLYRKGIGILHV